MKNGDISNDVPIRLLVTLDVVSTKEEKITKRYGLFRNVDYELKWNYLALNQLWNFSQRYGIVYTLIDFGVSNDDMQKFLDMLDQEAVNPFNYATGYSDVDELVRALPYMWGVKGVVDLPGRVMRYGSWGYELENL